MRNQDGKATFAILIALSLCLPLISGNTPQPKDPDPQIIHQLEQRNFLSKWIVAGPFPNNTSMEPLPDGSYDYGYYTDFLTELGGEAQANLIAGQKIPYQDPESGAGMIETKIADADPSGRVNLEKIVGRMDYKAAYAFCYVESDSTQMATFLTGSDDAVKVWINGDLVHQNYIHRGLQFGQDVFQVKLEKGLNPVLVKVVQGIREWEFAVEVLNSVAWSIVQSERQARMDLDRSLNISLIAEKANRWNYFFNPGEFPGLVWEDKYLVEKVHGEFDLNIRWFDDRLNEVRKAGKPGRYGFYAEGITADGVRIRRAGTMYCISEDWIAWGERFKAWLEPVPFFKKRQIWEDHRESIADFAGRIVLLSLLDQREGAVLMSYIDEMGADQVASGLSDTPVITDHDYHLALKRKILGMGTVEAALKLPARNIKIIADTLRKGSETEAGFRSGTMQDLRSICKQWYLDSGEPFQVLVARKGVVIINEAFGDSAKDAYDLQTKSEMASITKLLTGLMFAQFVDQGLIQIDDPVGKYLPDFPVAGDKAITLRQCFTHTSGLWGHEEWGGLHSPWLDNKIMSLLPHLPVGKIHEYNGMGYDLAGKVMEMVAGKSIFRLFRENFFDPLRLDNTILEEDLGFSCHSTAADFAVFGQLMLNRGSYGDLTFFSPETFEKLLPQPLDRFYPGIAQEWGIGITWMRQRHPMAGKGGYPNDHTILGRNMIGHGSATSAILNVDMDNEIVICQTRRNGGKNYDKSLEQFLLIVDDGLSDH